MKMVGLSRSHTEKGRGRGKRPDNKGIGGGGGGNMDVDDNTMVEEYRMVQYAFSRAVIFLMPRRSG